MLSLEEITRMFVREISTDTWCRDIIRINADDPAKAADRLKNWYLYFHDGGTIAEKIMRLVIPQLDWPAMVAAVEGAEPAD